MTVSLANVLASLVMKWQRRSYEKLIYTEGAELGRYFIQHSGPNRDRRYGLNLSIISAGIVAVWWPRPISLSDWEQIAALAMLAANLIYWWRQPRTQVDLEPRTLSSPK